MRRELSFIPVAFAFVAAGCTGTTVSPTATPEVSTPEASPSPSEPAPTASASAGPDPAAGEWVRALEFADGESQVVGDSIVYGSAGYLAIGSRWMGFEGGPRPTGYVAWHSGDGRDWEEVPFPTDFGELTVQELTVSADGDFIFYAIKPANDPTQPELVTLRSSDGVAWEEFESGLPEETFVQQVERGPRGYLLVAGQAVDTNPALWLSADGLGWEQVHEFEQTDTFIQLDDAGGGAEGYVVLGRRIATEGTAYQRFAFASADGREWFAADEPFGPDDQDWVFSTTVASTGPDWIATLGQPEGAPTAVWFSENGLDWTEHGSLDAPPNTSPGAMADTGIGLFFGVSGSSPFEGFPGFWSSSDGATWEEVDLGADAWITGLAESPGNVAVIGAVPNEPFTSSAGIWIRSTE